METEELKKKLLDMLEQDREFRYAVAGAIGYREILDRFASMQEEMNKRFLELRREMDERFAKVDERFAKVDERFAKVEEEIRDLREETNRLRQDMQEGFKRMDERLRHIESYIERTSITLEEEARDVIQYRLRERGLPMSITRLELPDIEIDIYGIDSDYCVIGEVKTRASPNTVERVDREIEMLCKRYPQYLRKNVIKAIYAMQITSDAVKEGERRSIWIVTAKGELTELKIVQN